MSRSETSSTSQSAQAGAALKLGDLLVREGLLTMDGLDKALTFQKKSKEYRPLGQVCVDLKLITKQDLQRFLSRHHKRIHIGELLMNMGLITQSQLNHVLHQQMISGNRFGTLLLQSGIINESQLCQALSVQLDIPRIVPSVELISVDLLKGLSEDFLRKHEFLPIHRHGNQLTVVMADPLNGDLLQQLIDLFKCKLVAGIAPASEILAAISELYNPKRKRGGGSEALSADLLEISDKAKHTKEQVAPIAQFLLTSAVEAGATALHIECQERYLRIRLRVEGVLRHRTDLPVRLGGPLVECYKTPFRVKRENYWEEHISTQVKGQQVDLSITTFKGLWGENLVIHILYPPSRLMGIENLGFSPVNQTHYQRVLERAGGMVLAVSPIRQGKSTLLYAALTHLNRLTRSILTLEESVDHPMPGVIQNEYKPDARDTYDELIQAMIDYDSDILMISDLKGQETAMALNQAALQGKKVLTSINAGDTTSAIYRLFELKAQSLLLAPVPLTLVSQRLLRKLCDRCKAPHEPSEEELRQLQILPADRSFFQFFQAVGCEACSNQGYHGITALHELLEINKTIQEAVNKGSTVSAIRELVRGQGRLISMTEDGVFKAIQGLTSLEEVKRVAMTYESEGQPTRSLKEIYHLCLDA